MSGNTYDNHAARDAFKKTVQAIENISYFSPPLEKLLLLDSIYKKITHNMSEDDADSI